MKRAKDLYEKICDIENLRIACKNAKRGKSKYKQVIEIEKNPDFYLEQIQQSLINKSFTTSDYIIEDIFDGKKQRTIHKLPFFPDRIVQHALIQIIEPILINSLIRDTFQSIKGRGISDARKRVTKFIKENNPKYCLQLDIKKYYLSVDNDILKSKIRKKIKCKDTLELIDDIIDSCKGLPIGNYTSQHFGNFYLNEFDHYIKETVELKGYFRYCDDLIFFSDNKNHLKDILNVSIDKLSNEKLEIKDNPKLFPMSQGLYFVGYIYRNNNIYLRKSIKNNFKKATLISIYGFWGWIKPINCINLWRNYVNIL